jgi:hypothetical protein
LRLSQREKECGSLVKSRFNPDSPIMSFNDSLNGRQANACAFEVRILVEPLKRPKKLADIGHIKSCTVVSDVEGHLASFVFLAERNPTFLLLCISTRFQASSPGQSS